MKMRWEFVVLICHITGGLCGGITNRGRTFFVAFSDNHYTGQSNQDLELFIMNAISEPVTVDVNAPLFLGYDLSETHRIPKEDYVKLTFNIGIRLDNTEVAPKGILVNSTGDIVVIAVNREKYTNDAYLALPEPALGTTYYAVCYFPTTYPSQFVVIGTKNNTDVEITLSSNPNATVIQFDNSTYGPGDTIRLSINQFDAVQIQSTGDITGSLVRTDKPVGFLSGNKRTKIGSGGWTSDHLVEYLPPVNKWGTKFASVPIPGRKVGDYFKVVASSANTNLKVQCSDVFGNGSNFEETLQNSGDFVLLHIPFEKYCFFVADNAVIVVQFVQSRVPDDSDAKHDPAMILITPVEQYESEYRFNTPRFTYGTYENFFMFVIKSDQRAGIRIDNDALPSNTVFVDIPGTDLVGGYVIVADGYHSIYHISPIVVFSGYLYGRARLETYGIPAGTRMANVNGPCSRSTSVPGDVLDNDCDGLIDEELDNKLDDDGDGEIDEDCAVSTYPIDGNWAQWLGWGSCSVTCTTDVNPTGLSRRYRTCSEPSPKYDGMNCADKGFEDQPCTPDRCPIAGHWSNWEPWNPCSMTCNPYTGSDLILSGTQTKSRSCSNPAPQYGGSPCDGNDTDTRSCQENSPCPGGTDGTWGTWGTWTECVRIRVRMCNNPAPLGTGLDCLGENNQSTLCSPDTTVSSSALPSDQCTCPSPQQTTATTTSSPSPPTPDEMAKILHNLNVQLRRNKKETSKYKRSLSSAPDARGSSKIIGCLMIGIIVICLLAFLLMDLDKLCRFLRERGQSHQI